MTLTAALRLALDPATHASNLTPLRQIVAHVGDDDDAPTARQGLVAHLCLAGLAPMTPERAQTIASAAPAILFTLLSAGGNLDDLRLVTMEPAVAPEMPRSAEWVSAAERLAAWADGVATVAEPAPWDEPTVMSDEDIADLVGL